MAKRAKSIQDIIDQRNRILEEEQRRGTDFDSSKRVEAVEGTTKRYLGNIAKTKAYQGDTAKYNQAFSEVEKVVNADPKDYNAIGNASANATDAAYKQGTRKYARSTYMGNANT